MINNNKIDHKMNNLYKLLRICVNKIIELKIFQIF